MNIICSFVIIKFSDNSYLIFFVFQNDKYNMCRISSTSFLFIYIFNYIRNILKFSNVYMLFHKNLKNNLNRDVFFFDLIFALQINFIR